MYRNTKVGEPRHLKKKIQTYEYQNLKTQESTKNGNIFYTDISITQINVQGGLKQLVPEGAACTHFRAVEQPQQQVALEGAPRAITARGRGGTNQQLNRLSRSSV